MTWSVVAACDDLDTAQVGVQVAVELGFVVFGRGESSGAGQQASVGNNPRGENW